MKLRFILLLSSVILTSLNIILNIILNYTFIYKINGESESKSDNYKSTIYFSLSKITIHNTKFNKTSHLTYLLSKEDCIKKSEISKNRIFKKVLFHCVKYELPVYKFITSLYTINYIFLLFYIFIIVILILGLRNYYYLPTSETSRSQKNKYSYFLFPIVFIMSLSIAIIYCFFQIMVFRMINKLYNTKSVYYGVRYFFNLNDEVILEPGFYIINICSIISILCFVVLLINYLYDSKMKFTEKEVQLTIFYKNESL